MAKSAVKKKAKTVCVPESDYNAMKEENTYLKGFKEGKESATKEAPNK